VSASHALTSIDAPAAGAGAHIASRITRGVTKRLAIGAATEAGDGPEICIDGSKGSIVVGKKGKVRPIS